MTNDLLSLCAGDSIGIALMLMVLVTNRGLRLKNKREKGIVKIIFVTISAAACDILGYVLNGIPGIVITVLDYAATSWLYLANVVLAYLWVDLLCECIGVHLPTMREILQCVNVAAGALLVINLFTPVVFSLKDNIYIREDFYWAFVAIGAVVFIFGMILYLRVRKKGGMPVSFPVWAFVAPMILGITVQSFSYGVSLIWAGISVGVVGMVASMKNELIYIDQLTCVYNRYFFEKLKKQVARKPSVEITGIMADLNHFKSINDRFGHKVGDEALCKTAEIMSAAVGNEGKVVRYAGDEFVILLNTIDAERVSRIVTDIEEGFARFNATQPDGYQLAAAMGYQQCDMTKQSPDEFMNAIDAKMYEKKIEMEK